MLSAALREASRAGVNGAEGSDLLGGALGLALVLDALLDVLVLTGTLRALLNSTWWHASALPGYRTCESTFCSARAFLAISQATADDLIARFPRTRILAASRQPEEIYAERALRAGASGYWMKTGTRDELIRAISTVLAGELYVSPRVALRAVH